MMKVSHFASRLTHSTLTAVDSSLQVLGTVQTKQVSKISVTESTHAAKGLAPLLCVFSVLGDRD